MKPGPKPGLTEMQKAFITHFMNSGDATDAARRAGFAHPGSRGYALQRLPLVAAAIEECVTAARLELKRGSLKLAIQLNKRVNDAATVKDLTNIARVTLPYVFESDELSRDKELHEMTKSEIDAKIAEIMGRGQTIEGELAEEVEFVEVEDNDCAQDMDVFG